jgi:hypothetical protein
MLARQKAVGDRASGAGKGGQQSAFSERKKTAAVMRRLESFRSNQDNAGCLS